MNFRAHAEIVQGTLTHSKERFIIENDNFTNPVHIQRLVKPAEIIAQVKGGVYRKVHSNAKLSARAEMRIDCGTDPFKGRVYR